MEGPCEHGSELLGLIKDGEFHEQLGNYQFLKKLKE
jgi:hypothetical protein